MGAKGVMGRGFDKLMVPKATSYYGPKQTTCTLYVIRKEISVRLKSKKSVKLSKFQA